MEKKGREGNGTEKHKLRKMVFFSVSDTGILGKRESEFSQQESNL